MSGYLWKYYLEDDVDRFRHVLTSTTHTFHTPLQKGGTSWQRGGHSAPVNSNPGSHTASPVTTTKGRKTGVGTAPHLTRGDINSRDADGLTILHHAASSVNETAMSFAQSLLEHAWTDLYIQDAENGWTPLHRAFYFGNIAIARLILNRDVRDILGHGFSGSNHHARGLVKIKDKEGYGPLDLFGMTIKDRTLRLDEVALMNSDSDDEMAHGNSGDADEEMRRRLITPPTLLGGDELYTFGSNKNVTLGFGDEDDRQFPERISLRRPDHLLQRFYREYCDKRNQSWTAMGYPKPENVSSQAKGMVDLPIHIRNTPLVIQDVQMSKLHTAVLTTDPISNLYICGHGPGGRLGTGNETTRYQFTCIEGGGLAQKKIAAVALGQNHTLAVSEEGEIFSWGNNAYGQLGYALPKPSLKDDDPISTIPRQIFGPLKREIITGIAASRIHSVVHTPTSLYTFGKNEGQLGIVDSDARSLEMQIVPRKIAASLFSSSVHSVSAIDGATICLLENREVWVFANYGYSKLSFPLDGFTSSFLKESWLTTKYDIAPNKIKKITSGGDTICALSTSGGVFTVAVSRRTDTSQDANTSTTNPKQIRGALSTPSRIWTSNKNHMVARDVAVDQDGSIILTTDVGSVWKRTKRATIQNAAKGSTGTKSKDYKFQRVSGLTRVVAVRASAFGAYAAIRKDCDVTRTELGVDEPKLWEESAPLLSFHEMTKYEETSDDEEPTPRFWTRAGHAQDLRKRVLKSKDLEAEVAEMLQRSSSSSYLTYDMEVATTLSDVRIPVHEFILSSRSHVLRKALLQLRTQGADDVIPELLMLRGDGKKIVLLFQGLDFLTIFDLVLYCYTDSLIDFWNVTRHYPKLAYRYRSIRTELMKVASRLEMRLLEPAVRQMVTPRRSLNMDMELAIKDETFFETGDVIIDLADGEMLLHSDIICQRCPFFQGMFRGRAAGQWLVERRSDESSLIRIDLTHVETNLFRLIVRHLYADAGEEMFADFTSEDLNDVFALDELLDHVMDVMSVANELMLDRLSQICQRLIGRYGNARNMCSLLAAVAPSSVAEFKDAALEYICLNIESVMQNGTLDELDDDLQLELNQVVRDNQLAYLPFTRSGRAEALLFDRYPELVENIDRNKRAKIDAIMLASKQGVTDHSSTPFKAKSLEDLAASPPRHRHRRRASKDGKSPVVRPELKGQMSSQDLMFEMSDEEVERPGSKGKAKSLLLTDQSMVQETMETPLGSPEAPWTPVRRHSRSMPQASSGAEEGSWKPVESPSPAVSRDTRPSGQPWGSAPLNSVKLDLKDIMTQASSSKQSNLTLGLSKGANETTSKSSHARISQKERKRIQQAQQLGSNAEKPQAQATPPAVSPWQGRAQQRTSSSSIMTPATPPSSNEQPQPIRSNSTPQLTMRQTIANRSASQNNKEDQAPARTPQPPSRITSIPNKRPGPNDKGMSVSTDPIPTPHSVRHIPKPSNSPTSPSHHLSMMEILSLQEAEKTSIRDAGAKRSLQDIQQEQEFQQWWDQESQRVMREEEQQKRAAERAARSAARGRERGRGRGKARGKDRSEDAGRGKGSREVSATEAAGDGKAGKTQVKEGGPSNPSNGERGGRRGRGAGRGGAGRGGTRGGRSQDTRREEDNPAVVVTHDTAT